MNRTQEIALMSSPSNQAALDAAVNAATARRDDFIARLRQSEQNRNSVVAQTQANAAPLLAALAALRKQAADIAARIHELHEQAEVQPSRDIVAAQRKHTETARILQQGIDEQATILRELRG